MTQSTAKMEIYLVSACLVGLATRYDGQSKPSKQCREFLQDKIWLPFCPEQLGGLATPRPAADLIGGDGAAVIDGRALVVTRCGQDVTTQFIAGAWQVLEIAKQQQVSGVCLKSRSPSCGVEGQQGVTAALLSRYGYNLIEF